VGNPGAAAWLFGRERSSGAHIQRKGRIESAQGGTLFLDEIGEMPSSIQVKLLRFLQERTIERVGGRSQIEVDARVVAATNVDLAQATKTGAFREDLFYRLAVVVVRLPPAERQNDLAVLAKSFLRRFAAQIGRENLEFSTQALKAINAHNWPGNVRELENRIKRAVIMAEGGRIMAEDLELFAGLAPAQAVRSARIGRARSHRGCLATKCGQDFAGGSRTGYQSPDALRIDGKAWHQSPGARAQGTSVTSRLQ
jgi:two-component system NtrC family response regulator